MSTSPRVSVIIPCYNAARFVHEAVNSVFTQTYTDYEVVVVNDGSPDTTELEQALAPWLDRIVYVKTNNYGPGGARNNGIRASRGELIALLDSDDVWEPNYLEVQASHLDQDPHADIVYPNALSFGDGPLSGTDCWYSRGQVTFTSLVRGQRDINSGRKLESGTDDKCVVFYSVLARRAALERVGWFADDCSYVGVEDLDLWLRCVKNGCCITYHNQVLVRYRRRDGSLSSDPVWMLGQITRVLSKARSTLFLTDEERHLLDSVLLHFEGNKAFQEGKRAFIAGDTPLAIELLQKANTYLNSTRLGMMILLIGTTPRLARYAYAWRRLFVGSRPAACLARRNIDRNSSLPNVHRLD
jgi:glycosyltransferase involved in cell wall biosynthesis